MKKYLLSLNFTFFLLFGFLLSIKGYAQLTVTPVLLSTEPVPATTISQGSTKQLLYSLKIDYAGIDPTSIQQIQFTTSGSYSAADISKFQIYYGQNLSNANLASDDIFSSSVGLGGEIITKTVLIVPNPGASYIFITADISSSAISGHTIKIVGSPTNLLLTTGMMGPFPPATIINQQTDLAGVQTIGNASTAALIASYTFCGNANDVSGNSNNGTVNGATLSTDRFGNANSAYSFDGTSNYISTPNLATSQSTNWTMSAWIKPSSSNQLGSILLNGYDDGGTGNGYSMIQSDGGSGTGTTLAGLYGGVAFFSSGNNLTTNWQQVTMTRSGGTTKFYINGVQTSSVSNSSLNTPSGTFRIGSQNGNRFFNGAIDDVKVYNSALTDAQILDTFNAENTPTTETCTPICANPPTITCPQNQEICKNSPIFDLSNIPVGATVTVGGIVNTDGKFDPSAVFDNQYYDGDGNANVPVNYTLTNSNGCISTCSYSIKVKRLPNENTSVYFTSNSSTALDICQNSGDVQLRFDGGTGSMEPFTYYYTVNNGDELSAGPGTNTHISLSTASTGSFVYKLTKVKIGNGCEIPINKTATLNVNALPTVTLSGGATYCEGENTATTLTITSSIAGTISGTLSDGSSFSGTSPITVIISPTQTTTYTIATVNGTNCPGVNSGSATITVKKRPNDNTGLYFVDNNNFGVQTLTVCQNSGNVNLRFDGGIGNIGPFTYYYTLNNGPEQSTSSSGNSDFYLSTTTAGQFVYKLTRVSLGNGCERDFNISATLNISPVTNVSISGPNPAAIFCEGENTATTLTITSSIAGTISGTLSDGSSFSGTSPITVSISPTQTTTYTIATINGTTCPGVNSGSVTITVNPKPLVSCRPNMSVCINTGAFTLSGSTPIGGTYSGTGVNAGMFNPATAGLGNHVITYSFTNEFDCSNTCQFTISVTNATTASLTYPAASVCKSETSFAPTIFTGTGGSFSTLPISGLSINSLGVINPSASTAGTYTVKYIIPASGACPAVEASAMVEIKANPAVACPANYSVCLSTSAFGLSGSTPTGGTYSGTGVSAGMFSPATAGLGNHTITYSFTDGNGCSAICSFVITVIADATVSITYPAASVCKLATSFTPNITSSSVGTFSSTVGLSINPTTGIINPSTSTAGPYLITYTISGACGIIVSANVTISPASVLSASASITHLDCKNSGNMGTIDQTVTGGTGNYTYLWSTGQTIEDISGLASGTYSVTISDPNGCASIIVKSYVVNKPSAVIVAVGSITQACNGNNGTATLSATGGTPGYFFSSIGGSITGGVLSAVSGTYIVTATDSKGCTATASVIITDCLITGGTAACSNPQGYYSKPDNTACNETGTSLTSKQSMLNAINAVSGSYTFGLAANNRTFTLTLADINVGDANAPIFKMLPGGGNNIQRFGTGGATYSNTATWSRVPLATNGKITNPLFAQTITMFFNLKNNSNFSTVSMANIIYTQAQTTCGSGIATGEVIATQLPSAVISYMTNNGYSMTVSGLFQLANDALGGKSGVPNLSTINTAMDKINNAFTGCRIQVSGIAAPVFSARTGVKEGSNAVSGPAKGGIYLTMIEGSDAENGAIIAVSEIDENGQAQIGPLLNGTYKLIFGTNPMGSRIPQAISGYVFAGENFGKISNNLVTLNVQNDVLADGILQIENGSSANGRVAIDEEYEVNFALAPAAPLPVRLISFTGKPIMNGNLLEWKTSSEINFSHYEVERSEDAKTFEKIGTVNGNNAEVYEYIDNSSFINQRSTLYYRLRMVDLDRKIDYSKTIFIKVKAEFDINTYPNPANDIIYLENVDSKTLNIKILDSMGREPRSEAASSESLIKIDVKGLATGIYFLQISNGGAIQYKKVMVNRK